MVALQENGFHSFEDIFSITLPVAWTFLSKREFVGGDADATSLGFVGGDADGTNAGFVGGDADGTNAGFVGGDADGTNSGAPLLIRTIQNSRG